MCPTWYPTWQFYVLHGVQRVICHVPHMCLFVQIYISLNVWPTCAQPELKNVDAT